jgi:hypothetical protein
MGSRKGEVRIAAIIRSGVSMARFIHENVASMSPRPGEPTQNRLVARADDWPWNQAGRAWHALHPTALPVLKPDQASQVQTVSYLETFQPPSATLLYSSYAF